MSDGNRQFTEAVANHERAGNAVQAPRSTYLARIMQQIALLNDQMGGTIDRIHTVNVRANGEVPQEVDDRKDPGAGPGVVGHILAGLDALSEKVERLQRETDRLEDVI